MNRNELRFKMLLEYYKEEHGIDGMKSGDANKQIREMGASDVEKTAAKKWLIDSDYVEGMTHYYGSKRPSFISGIDIDGVNLVEHILYEAFVEIDTKISNTSSLSKTEKIQKFIKGCSEHPATSEIGKIILDAVIRNMTKLTDLNQ